MPLLDRAEAQRRRSVPALAQLPQLAEAQVQLPRPGSMLLPEQLPLDCPTPKSPGQPTLPDPKPKAWTQT